MPVWLTEHEYRGPPGCLRPDAALRPGGTGGRGGRSSRLHRHPAGGLHLRPAADLGRRSDVGSDGRRRQVRPLPLPERAGRVGVAHAHRRLARAARARVQRSGDRAARARTDAGWPRSGTTSLPSTETSSGDDCGPTRHSASSCTATAVKACTAPPSTAGNRGWRSGGPTSEGMATCSHAATATRTCPGPDDRRHHHRLGAGGLDRGRGPDAGRVVGGDHGKGTQPPARCRRPDQARIGLLQRRDQVHGASLPGSRSPHRAPRIPSVAPTRVSTPTSVR